VGGIERGAFGGLEKDAQLKWELKRVWEEGEGERAGKKGKEGGSAGGKL